MTKIDTETTRTYSGEKNNKKNPSWGAANTHLLREDVGHGYEDGIGEILARTSGPSPRYVSNKVCQVEDLQPNAKKLSDFMWAWGQYLDHEIDLTLDGGEEVSIPVPENDPHLRGTIHFKRSNIDPKTGKKGPRQQVNVISAYIDASNVYGSDRKRANALRAMDGTGKLKTSGSGNNLPPIDVKGPDNELLDNANLTGESGFFFAGDVRVNEVSILTAMHTLFLREHNRRCEQISSKKPGLNDEEIYQRARRYIGALEQVITYEEFLPALLGKRALSPYKGYKQQVNAGVSNLFSTASYRLGHAMVSETVRVDNELGSLTLREIFFTPSLIKKNGIEPFLSGLARQKMKNIDAQIVDSLRSFLFHEQVSGGLDLAALNMQRGRDHGLPDYNTCRERLGLKRKARFREISTKQVVADALQEAYGGNINAIDPWVGGMAEDHKRGANVGELTFAVLKDQFERFRDGDRFWYERDTVLRKELREVDEDLDTLKKRTLSRVIRDNTNLRPQPNVFKVSYSGTY